MQKTREGETEMRSEQDEAQTSCSPEKKEGPDPCNAGQAGAPERLELRFLTSTNACETTKPVKNQETPPSPHHLPPKGRSQRKSFDTLTLETFPVK